jgi:hypothetical protein
MMKGLSQVSHYPGETVIRIDCNQLGSIPNTNPHFPHQGRVGSPLVQLRSYVTGSISAAPSGTDQLPGQSGLACPWTHIWLPAHPYYL